MNEVQTEPLTEPKKEPEKKKGGALGTILAIIFIGIIVVGFPYLVFNWDMFKGNVYELYNKITDKIFNVSGPSSEEVVKKSIEKYVGGYKDEKENDYGYLFLRDDSTFAFDTTVSDCNNPAVGTYIINGKKIIFKTKIKYGCGDCFSTTDAKEYEGTIDEENNSISIVDEQYKNGLAISEEYTFKRTDGFTEGDTERKRFILEPINNGKPEDSNQMWIDCSR